MQSGDTGMNQPLTLTCNESSTFSRSLVTLLRQWDRNGRIKIERPIKSELGILPNEDHLCLLDENGISWKGAEALPHIFKNLPFGKLAAAIYTLPGTMWFTKQLYSFNSNEPDEQYFGERLH
jgi:hypothetical protein